MPAIAPVDRSELLPPAPEDPDDPALPLLDVVEAPAAATSVDLYSNAMCSADMVKTAFPEMDMVVESTLTQVSWTSAPGPKLKAVVDEGHSDRPLTIIVSSPCVTVPSHHVE
jgi:hypothetical protein